MKGFDPITSVVWKDAHQTMAVLRTAHGVEHVLPAKFLPRGLVALACYTPLSGRFANTEHTAAVIETIESGAVMITPDGTPALWEAAHATIPIASYDPDGKVPEAPSGRLLGRSSRATLVLDLPPDLPEAPRRGRTH